LRREPGCPGYTHLKAIPNASRELLVEAGRWADRLSMNVELPRQQDLDALAPDKDLVQIGRSIRLIRDGIDEAREEHATARVRTPPSFSPAGQATQMIVGATAATDRD